MKCKKLTIISGMFLSAFLAFLSFSSCHALSDIVYTVDSSHALPSYFCGGSSGVNCSDYDYFIISPNFLISDTSNFSYSELALNTSFSNGSSITARQNNVSIGYSKNIIIKLENITDIRTWWVGSTSGFPQDWQIKFTFTESISSGGITPEGTLNIAENGQYDVTNYAQVDVNIPQTPATYHDDLAEIKKAILIGSATLLVLYFFYCIYRIIISYGGSR